MARTVTLQNKSVDPVGAPDFTLPVSILAQIIESLKVDIAAQSIPKLQINIKSIDSGVVFNVAQSGSWTVNAAQTGAWTINIGQPLDANGNLKTSIQASVTLNVQTPAGVQLNVNIAHIDSGVVFNVAQSGTWTVNVQTPAGVQLNVNIAHIDSGVVFNVAQSGTWTINAAQSGSWTVNAVQSGSWTINVTGSVTVTSGTVDVKTSGGANIVIDKLTQGAYTERQSTLANNGATATMTPSNLTNRRGKFFPRGCRGFIRSIEIYCNNADTASHTFTIKISPMPGMGPVATFTLSVPANSGNGWRSVTVGRFWNYDSLFIWVSSDSDSYGGLGYDAGEPYDFYNSTDEVSWTFGSYRFWFRVNLSGETVGDLPVSGTVNTIEVPASATYMQGAEKSVPNDTETSLVTVYGSGSVVEMGVVFYTATAPGGAVMYLLYAYADGQLAGIWSNVVATQSSTATSGRCPVGIFVQRSADTTLVFWIPLKFRRSFELRCRQTTGSSCTAYGRVIVNMIA
jgi:hypothetical protein